MKKTASYWVFFSIMLLVLINGSIRVAAGQSARATITLSSSGSITLASGTNYAVIPGNWWIGQTWCAPTYLDNTVLHNGPSIRMERGDGTKSREILLDTTGISNPIVLKAGDHIVVKIWMKTSPSTTGEDNTIMSGVRFGIDFYGAGSGDYIAGIANPDGLWYHAGVFPPASSQDKNYVHWNSDWQQRTMEVIVPAQIETDNISPFGLGVWKTPVHMTLWVQAWSAATGNLDNGIAWFSDTELYINP